MDPIQAHRERQAGMVGKARALRDAQMGNGPEPPQVDWSKPLSEQVPPCPNCGQIHFGERGCPHAVHKSPFTK